MGPWGSGDRPVQGHHAAEPVPDQRRVGHAAGADELFQALCLADDGRVHDRLRGAVARHLEDRDLEDACDNLLNEVVETAEPIDNFRPVDVMTDKKAGREVGTPYGTVVIRKNVQRAKGSPRETMYLFRDEARDLTLVGWGK